MMGLPSPPEPAEAHKAPIDWNPRSTTAALSEVPSNEG
jgi:hypothetical protein